MFLYRYRQLWGKSGSSAKELVQLADRELDLLSRGLMTSSLSGLQSRLRALLRHYVIDQLPHQLLSHWSHQHQHIPFNPSKTGVRQPVFTGCWTQFDGFGKTRLFRVAEPIFFFDRFQFFECFFFQFFVLWWTNLHLVDEWSDSGRDWWSFLNLIMRVIIFLLKHWHILTF